MFLDNPVIFSPVKFVDNSRISKLGPIPKSFDMPLAQMLLHRGALYERNTSSHFRVKAADGWMDRWTGH